MPAKLWKRGLAQGRCLVNVSCSNSGYTVPGDSTAPARALRAGNGAQLDPAELTKGHESQPGLLCTMPPVVTWARCGRVTPEGGSCGNNKVGHGGTVHVAGAVRGLVWVCPRCT